MGQSPPWKRTGSARCGPSPKIWGRKREWGDRKRVRDPQRGRSLSGSLIAHAQLLGQFPQIYLPAPALLFCISGPGGVPFLAPLRHRRLLSGPLLLCNVRQCIPCAGAARPARCLPGVHLPATGRGRTAGTGPCPPRSGADSRGTGTAPDTKMPPGATKGPRRATGMQRRTERTAPSFLIC